MKALFKRASVSFRCIVVSVIVLADAMFVRNALHDAFVVSKPKRAAPRLFQVKLVLPGKRPLGQ